MPAASTDGDSVGKSNFSGCLVSPCGKQGLSVTCVMSRCNKTCANTWGVRKCYRMAERCLCGLWDIT